MSDAIVPSWQDVAERWMKAAEEAEAKLADHHRSGACADCHSDATAEGTGRAKTLEEAAERLADMKRRYATDWTDFPGDLQVRYDGIGNLHFRGKGETDAIMFAGREFLEAALRLIPKEQR